MTDLLRVEGLSVFHGAVQALRRVDLRVAVGEIVTLIGANGAGKSTLMMSVCGQPPAREGRVMFDGVDITRMPTAAIMRQGIAQAPEGRRVFPRMTVAENLAMGAQFVARAEANRAREQALALFPALGERLAQRAGTLSGGEQQMLAIARALMGSPRLLLLDEPSLGLAPLVTRAIFGALQRLNEAGLTVLLVEQNANLALRVAHRGYGLANGSIVLHGSGRELLDHAALQATYLKGSPAPPSMR